MAPFKANWEKAKHGHHLPSGVIEKMVELFCPKQKLISYKNISDGAGNLNIKIQLENQEHPFLLRIYLRDKTSALREQKLGELLKDTLPVPKTYYIGEVMQYKFAITEFIDGITLRDLLLFQNDYDLVDIMPKLANMLVKISSYQFPKAGFFDDALNLVEDGVDFLSFAKNTLPKLSMKLDPRKITQIEYLLKRHGNLLFDLDQYNLVHGDFDPANILVSKIDNCWKITAVLDWEFSFSGSYFWDIANMLRYRDQMPAIFETAFLEALQFNLPKNWRNIVDMINLVSLLDLLDRTDSKNTPNRFADIILLIDAIIARTSSG